MESLYLDQYLPYLLILIGGVITVIPLFYRSKTEALEKTGERCEGVIFKLGYKNSFGLGITNSSVKDKITVRFVTKKKEWITEDLNMDFTITYTGQYKEGERVVVVYNPNNPSEFTLETKQSPVIGKLLFFFIGLAFLGIGVYKLFKPA